MPALPTPCCGGPVKDVLWARELAAFWADPVPMTWSVMDPLRIEAGTGPPVGEDVSVPVGGVVPVVAVLVGFLGKPDQKLAMPADRSGSGTGVGPLGGEPKL